MLRVCVVRPRQIAAPFVVKSERARQIPCPRPKAYLSWDEAVGRAGPRSGFRRSRGYTTGIPSSSCSVSIVSCRLWQRDLVLRAIGRFSISGFIFTETKTGPLHFMIRHPAHSCSAARGVWSSRVVGITDTQTGVEAPSSLDEHNDRQFRECQI